MARHSRPHHSPSHILATEHRDDEVGLLAVEIGQIESQIGVRKLRRVEPIIEHPLFIKAPCKGLGDLLNVVALSPRERQGNAESFPGPRRIQRYCLSRKGWRVVETTVMLGVLN
jgi:hypothetical protein